MTAALKILLGLLLLCTLTGMAVAADKEKEVKATGTWKGSNPDETLVKETPENGVITNAKDFEKLVKSWKVADKVPEVNFDKDLVIVNTTSGSRLFLNPSIDDKGDLKAFAISTRDFGPGFRYLIVSVPKEGVKTVNGKALPK